MGEKDDTQGYTQGFVIRMEWLSVEVGKTVGRSNFGEKIRHVDFGSSLRHPGGEIYWAAWV